VVTPKEARSPRSPKVVQKEKPSKPEKVDKDKKKKEAGGGNAGMGVRVDKIEKFLNDAFNWLDPGTIPICKQIIASR